tara:strand:+ start:124573 stop:125808 length:1236 start_codon:yes stop_codon:yes gene_type:complete
MPKNKVIYQSEALFVGPSPAKTEHFLLGSATGVVSDTLSVAQEYDGRLSLLTEGNFASLLTNSIEQLHRIQSISYDFGINRTDVNQFGELAAIDRIILDSPTVNLSFSYLLANMANEKNLGLVTDGQETVVRDLINKTADEKNYFIRTSTEGVDAIGDETEAGEVIGIGNGYLTSYSSTASVGDLPSVSISVEGLNMIFDNDVSGNLLPAINTDDGSVPTGYTYHIPVATSNQDGVITGDLAISVLRPGDITVSIKKRVNTTEDVAVGDYDIGGVDIDGACIQSYNISFDLGRTPIQCLGKRNAIDRSLDFPIPVAVSVDALVGDLTTGNLSDIIDCDNSYDVIVDLKEPACGSSTQDIVSRYIVKDTKIDSQSYSSSIGDNKTVTLSMTSQVAGNNQGNKGIYFSGVAGA